MHRRCLMSRIQSVPNQSLQQTGHATDASARHAGFAHVSRLLSLLFGGAEPAL